MLVGRSLDRYPFVMQLARVLVSWVGPAVKGLSANVLHFAADGGPPSPAAIKTAYQAIGGCIPTGQSVLIPNSGDIIEDTTGELIDVWTAGVAGQVDGAGGTAVAAGVGACVSWKTGGIINGRRLRGRTFLVPFATSSYDTDGTLTSTANTQVANFRAAMMASGPMAVWHRPTTKGGTDGNSYGIVSSSHRDVVAFLSSRRE